MKTKTTTFLAARTAAEQIAPRLALALLGATATIALLTHDAHSQTVTQPITVTAKPEDEAITVPNAEEAKKRIEKTAGGVDIVPAAEVRDGRAQTVKDILGYVPGVQAQSKYGQEDSRISIRGSGLSRSFHLRGTRILRDGVPITDADGSGDTMEIDPLAMDYTEIYKGANALQYGASLLGGAVNFVSPTGRSNPGFLLRQEFGSFDTTRTQFGMGAAQGNFDYYITPTYASTSGFRDHTDGDYKRLNGNIGYRFGDGAETRFFLSAADINQKIPSSLTKAQALSNPQQTAASSFVGNTKRNIDSLRGANKTTFLTDTGEVTVGAFMARKELFHPLYSPPFFTPVIDNDETNGGGFVKWYNDLTLAGHRNEITLGANYFAGINQARTYNNVGGSRGALTAFDDQISRTFEIYGDNAFYVVKDVAFITGLQGTIAKRELDDKFLSNGDRSFERGYNSINPKVGLRWDYAPSSQAFVNLSWADEPPPFSELGTTGTTNALESQKSKTLELGMRGERGDVAWDAAIYRAWLQDELQTILVNGQSTNLNIGSTIHQGLELGGAWTAMRNLAAQGDKLSLRGAYTYSDFHFDNHSTYGNNDIPGAPRHFLVAELRYTHASGWYAGPNVEWVPQAYDVDNANTLKTEPYALLGAKAGYDFGGGLKMFIDGRNLLDKKYIADVSVLPTGTASSAQFNPGDGRAVYLGVEYRW
jgi:iron complex outermembrane receptor protein